MLPTTFSGSLPAIHFLTSGPSVSELLQEEVALPRMVGFELVFDPWSCVGSVGVGLGLDRVDKEGTGTLHRFLVIVININPCLCYAVPRSFFKLGVGLNHPLRQHLPLGY